MTQSVGLEHDPLGRWLEGLRPSTAVFCRALVEEPWGFRIEARKQSTFHILTQGSAVLEVDGLEDPIDLSEGDFVLLTDGSAHQLRDRLSSPTPPLMEAVGHSDGEGKVFEFGGDGHGGGAGTHAVMVCGGVQLGAGGTLGLAPVVAPVVRYRCDTSLVRLVDEESRALASGGEVVLLRILTLLVTQALRSHLMTRDERERASLLSGHLPRALAFVHSNLDQDIGMSELCAAAGLSRSALSARFLTSLGMSPIRYLRSVRLARAAELLSTTDSTLESIARAVGYSSAATLSRAFRRQFGTAPGEHRRAGKQV